MLSNLAILHCWLCFAVTSLLLFLLTNCCCYMGQDGDALNDTQPEVMSSALPMRLVDYFLVVGVNGFKVKSNGS